eukprot:Lithocolla_globosa_v1_NODE_1131_length_2848_cov_232.486574.p3 type:complete len:100 gc:universal NODE_1131_length_2848_cov_232.486574:1635-1934(+)
MNTSHPTRTIPNVCGRLLRQQQTFLRSNADRKIDDRNNAVCGQYAKNHFSIEHTKQQLFEICHLVALDSEVIFQLCQHSKDALFSAPSFWLLKTRLQQT